MSYANQLPAGSKNHVEKIAIVGGGGQSGSYMVKALLKTGKHTVTAITRADSTSTFAEGVLVKKVDYDDASSLVNALKGQDVLIITMGVMAPGEQQTKLIAAAASAKVPWVFPNEFGNDLANPALRDHIPVTAEKTQYRDQVEELGVSSWIGFCPNFWYEYSLGGGQYGIDIPNRKATFWDDGKTRLNTSTLPQVGRGMAALLSLKVLPDNEKDSSACLSNFKNKFVYISSFCVNQEEMLESVQRVTNTTAKDWSVSHRPVQEVYNEGLEKLKSGNFMGMIDALYARIFFPDGAGNYEATKGLQNEILGLPKEDLDEYTSIAVENSSKKKAW